MERMVSIVLNRSTLALFASAMLLVFSGACSTPVPPLAVPPPDVKPSETGLNVRQLELWDKSKPGGSGSKTVRINHLKECGGDSDCSSDMACTNLFGTPLCFYTCDPKRGTGNVQNPDCFAPENCAALSNGGGVCLSVPGQLYGIGTYQGIVNRKKGEACLTRFGGCGERLLCVYDGDLSKDASKGKCVEECNPGVTCKQNSDCPNNYRCKKGRCAALGVVHEDNQCTSPNETCTLLASGFGACLRK